MRILFICKENECYGFSSYTRRSSGLYNSVRFVVASLNNSGRGVHAKVVEVIDNNCIDRVVSEFKPDKVVIEALWVVPEKFDVLKSLHPNVQWFVHLHSEMPFLALEGMAIDWIIESAHRGVGMIANSVESYNALSVILSEKRLCYLSNVYLGPRRRIEFDNDKPDIDVACFGAIRPLKNHLNQALAAIQFAQDMGKGLRFHVNASRVETGGDPVLRNLVDLFQKTKNAVLMCRPWLEPDGFMFVLSRMDIGMQVSLSETFNIVSANYVQAGLPIVVSDEVDWASRMNTCEEDSVPDMVRTMKRVWQNQALSYWNQFLLWRRSKSAQCAWIKWARAR